LTDTAKALNDLIHIFAEALNAPQIGDYSLIGFALFTIVLYYSHVLVDFFSLLYSDNGKLRDELLNREIFITLTETSILIEEWRKEYNQVKVKEKYVKN